MKLLDPTMLEFLFAELLNSLKLSLDAAYKDREESVLDDRQQYNASLRIARAEVERVLNVIGPQHEDNMREKHRAIMRRIKHYSAELKSYSSDIKTHTSDTIKFVKGYVRFLTDAHILLTEDTSNDKRQSVLTSAGCG